MSASDETTSAARWVVAGAALTAVAMLGLFAAELGREGFDATAPIIIPLILGLVALGVVGVQIAAHARSRRRN